MKNLRNIFPFVLLCLGLSSCLDDDYITGNNNESPNIVEFPEQPNVAVADGYLYPVYVKSAPISNEEEIVVPVSYSGTNQAPEDIVVNVSIDQAMINAYNNAFLDYTIEQALVGIAPEDVAEVTEEATKEAEAQFFTMIPANLFSIPSQVTIKKGERRADLVIKVNTANFDLTKRYGLPLKLTSQQATVSGNFGTAIFGLAAKNKYDGNYTVTATKPMVDAVNATITGFYPLDADLVTVNANTVKMFTYTYLGGLEGHPIKSNGSNSYYGNFAPMFTMDDAGNVVSVTNYYGQGTNASGRAAKLDPTGVNKFTVSADGQTKTLEVSYIMVQGGVDRTFFHEKWTFEADRE